MIHTGDCLEVMATLDAESIDAIVTDPPYGLEFMGKAWDKLDAGLPQEKVWKGRRGNGGSSIGSDDSGPASRHHVSFGGGKTGFKRCSTCGKRAFSGSPCQCLEPTWVIEYNDGAPSSAIRMQRWHEAWARAAYRVAKPGAYLLAFGGTRTVHRMTCAIEDAGWIIRDMLVWGYASGFPKGRANLKPAWEPIVMARKPGPLRPLAIDECRIGFASERDQQLSRPVSPNTEWAKTNASGWGMEYDRIEPPNPAGRWPANVVLTDPIFDGGWDGVVGGGETGPTPGLPGFYERLDSKKPWDTTSYPGTPPGSPHYGYGDSGTYSRFFLIPKAARSDREPVIRPEWAEPGKRASSHPTVKPVDLMRHLVRLVTPPGGTVLDPFLGSGTTALAAEMEGFAWIGIEREAEYVAIAEARLNGTQRGMAL